jgi:hypothetical protein
MVSFTMMKSFFKFFWIPRDMFLNFVKLFKDHSEFSSLVKQRHHFCHNLLIALKYFGCQGSAASAIHVKDGIDIGKCSVQKIMLIGLLQLSILFITSIVWPNAAK